MTHAPISIRPFIGAKNFDCSRRFYLDLDFQESILSHNLSYFNLGNLGFYLQDAYVQDWIENSMIFLEVADLDLFYATLLALDLPAKYPDARLIPIQTRDWGRECFLHDPSGILWHIGAFNK